MAKKPAPSAPPAAFDPPAQGGSYLIGRDGQRVRQEFTREQEPGRPAAEAPVDASAKTKDA